jgi:hypothetical protein
MCDAALEQDWRRIVLYGQNVASYKFALARALLQLEAQGDSLIRLEDLAVPFSNEIARHLELADTQATSKSSRFLDACREYNRGLLTAEQLRAKTVQLGFANVIDAFHTVDRVEVFHRFFIDERKTDKGIRLTDDFYKLVGSIQHGNLLEEAESRWRLVETAWDLRISPRLLRVDYDHKGRRFFIQSGLKRINITSARSALDGYQSGQCFYCFTQISIVPGDSDLADVDHFYPWIAMSRGLPVNLDALWNLVLACTDCNRGPNGKFEHMPARDYVQRLHTRNEWLIKSHKPLRETLFKLAGKREIDRKNYLLTVYKEASTFTNNPRPWSTPLRAPSIF